MNAANGKSTWMIWASKYAIAENTRIRTHGDRMNADVVEKRYLLNQLVMAKSRTSYKQPQKKIIHSLKCGCKCFEFPGKKPFWEKCFQAEYLAEQFGMGKITLNQYSAHFKLEL